MLVTTAPPRPVRAKPAKAQKRATLIPDTTGGAIGQAVSIWLAVLAATKIERSADLGIIPPTIELTDSQRSVLEEHQGVLALVRGARRGVSIASCSSCDRWTLATGPSSTCRMTLGCRGKTKRITAAKRQWIELPGIDSEAVAGELSA